MSKYFIEIILLAWRTSNSILYCLADKYCTSCHTVPNQFSAQRNWSSYLQPWNKYSFTDISCNDSASYPATNIRKQLIIHHFTDQNTELLFDIQFPLEDNSVAGPSMLPSGTETSNTKKKNKKSKKDTVTKRAAKKCWKCEIEGCKGRVRKDLCTNACVSWKSKECKGKDSRHPALSCAMVNAQDANESMCS